jgi:phage terminase large subunit-like protein
MIPRDCLLEATAARGTANLLDSVQVRHVPTGRISRLLFKAYNQGRVAWQAQTVDGVWFDEEPPPDVYSEGVTRTNVGLGPVFLTFTPLLGMSQVAAGFFLTPDPDSALVKMALREAEHYTPEQVAQIMAGWPAHERAARGEGTPMLGSGAVFPVPEDRLVVQDFPVPGHWPRIGGLDFGWDHPFGAVELAYEPSGDVVYLVRCYRVREATPLVHAATLKVWGANLRWAWPHDGLQTDKGSGEQLAGQYRKHGLKMLAVRATFPDGSNHVEPGLLSMLQRMETGRWKVFASCGDWLEEYRTYHRKDGKLVKLGDDTISASRYALMMLRYAAAPDAEGIGAGRQAQAIED